MISFADRDAYDALLERIHLHVPHTGWQSVQQLPRLSAADLSACLRAHPDYIDDVMLNASDLAAELDVNECAAGEYVAVSVLAQLRTSLKRQLLRDLQELEDDASEPGTDDIGAYKAARELAACELVNTLAAIARGAL